MVIVGFGSMDVNLRCECWIFIACIFGVLWNALWYVNFARKKD